VPGDLGEVKFEFPVARFMFDGGIKPSMRPSFRSLYLSFVLLDPNVDGRWKT
jgi:hypothetical protein